MKSRPFGSLLTNTTHTKTDSLSVADKIQLSLISLVYSQTIVGMAASLFCATIIAIGLFDSVDKVLLSIWYSLFVGVLVLRVILAQAYVSRAEPDANIQRWRQLFIVGAFLSGVLWGMTGAVLFPLDNTYGQLLISLVLAGTVAGAVPLLSGVLGAAVAFIVPALLPLIINLFYHQILVLFNLTVAVYLVYLVILSIKMHETIRTAVSLQYENSTLLTNLSEAKSQLEIINKKLEEIATHDPLTNVANRNLFNTYFTEAIEFAKQNKRILALLYLDLDDFKNVNDTFGHHIGDQLLLVLVDRLEEFFGTIDVVARLGGDEFAIILENVLDPNEVAKIARRICHTLSQPVIINQMEVKSTVSIGIAVYPLDGDSADDLLKVADKAMYYVKEHGGNNFRFNVTLLAD